MEEYLGRGKVGRTEVGREKQGSMKLWRDLGEIFTDLSFLHPPATEP